MSSGLGGSAPDPSRFTLFSKPAIKTTGELTSGSSRTFLGRQIEHHGDSISLSPLPGYIDDLLDVFKMKSWKNPWFPQVLQFKRSS